MRRYASKLFWLIVFAGLAGFLVYGFLPKPVEVEAVSPTIGSIQITVDDDGETRIREEYVIAAPVTGKMLRVSLKAGDAVIAGETEIARIEPSDPSLLDARMRAEADARVRVSIAAHSQSTTAVDRAEEAVELAKKDFERAKKLIASRAVSQAEYETIENRLRLAYADLRTAESAERVAAYEIDQAKAAVDYVSSVFDPNEENLFKVVSPINGRVLEVYRDDSGVIASGTPIVRIGDASDLEIVIDILSIDAVKVRPNDKVIIEHWGGNKSLAAVVRLVEPSAFLKVSALGVEEKRVNVIADFVDPFQDRETLGDGFRVEAMIVVEETPIASLKVPAGVLFRQGSDWYVFRIVDGIAEQVNVQVGRSNGIETEILAGIQNRDRLVQYPTELVQSGVKLKISQSSSLNNR